MLFRSWRFERLCTSRKANRLLLELNVFQFKQPRKSHQPLFRYTQEIRYLINCPRLRRCLLSLDIDEFEEIDVGSLGKLLKREPLFLVRKMDETAKGTRVASPTLRFSSSALYKDPATETKDPSSASAFRRIHSGSLLKSLMPLSSQFRSLFRRELVPEQVLLIGIGATGVMPQTLM